MCMPPRRYMAAATAPAMTMPASAPSPVCAPNARAFVAREDGGADQRDDEILKFVDRDVCRRESGRKMEPVGDESERRIERQRQHPIREREEHRRAPQHPELSIRADKEPLEAWRDHGGPAWIGGVL